MSGTCKFEPRWHQIFPHVPKPDASEEAKRSAAEWLAGEKLECSKLQLSPTACHGCPDNPLGDEADTINIEAVARQTQNLRYVGRLHTMAKLGLLRLEDISPEDFEMLSVYFWESERKTFEQSRFVQLIGGPPSAGD